jgi:hypothetical protein
MPIRVPFVFCFAKAHCLLLLDGAHFVFSDGLDCSIRAHACQEKVVLSMARFRLCGHNLRIETGRHEGLPRNERSWRRCKRL